MSSPGWTAEAVRALPVTTDIVTAGSVLCLGRGKSYELARRGEFPVPVLRLGAEYRVPTAALLQLLGIECTDSQSRSEVEVAGPACTSAPASAGSRPA